MQSLRPKLEGFLLNSGFNGVHAAGRFAANQCIARSLLKVLISFSCLKTIAPQFWMAPNEIGWANPAVNCRSGDRLSVMNFYAAPSSTPNQRQAGDMP